MFSSQIFGKVATFYTLVFLAGSLEGLTGNHYIHFLKQYVRRLSVLFQYLSLHLELVQSSELELQTLVHFLLASHRYQSDHSDLLPDSLIS